MGEKLIYICNIIFVNIKKRILEYLYLEKYVFIFYFRTSIYYNDFEFFFLILGIVENFANNGRIVIIKIEDFIFVC